MESWNTPESVMNKTHVRILSRMSLGIWTCLTFMLLACSGNLYAVEGTIPSDPEKPDIIGPIDPLPPIKSPTISVEDIREEDLVHQTIKVHFPWFLAIDPESIGDGDIVVSGPDGYEQKAELVSLDLNLEDLVDSLDPVPTDNKDLVVLPQPEPNLTATFQVSPAANADGLIPTWGPEHNGTYAVHLLAEAIQTLEGPFLPPTILGGFRVAIGIGELETIQPIETRIHISRRPTDILVEEIQPDGIRVDPTEGGYWAKVELVFDCPTIEVKYADLLKDGNTFLAEVKAVKLPLPDPEPVPVLKAGATENLEGDPDRPFVLTIRMETYALGLLEPGEYRFLVTVNDEREGLKEFRVNDEPAEDIDPPEAGIKVHNITQAYDGPQRIQVVYEDPSGVDLASIGDGDIKVHAPCLFLEDAAAEQFPCSWKVQRARLIEVITSSDSLNRVAAIYEIDSPEGGWTHEHNGFYPIIWCGEEVCDRLGNCNREMRLGGFEVAIEPGNEPPISAEAEVHIDASDPENVLATVHIQFLEHAMVVAQDVFRDGNRIYLLAKAEHLAVPAISPPPPPPSQDLVYELGPLEEGRYIALFEMNEHLYASREFKVAEDPNPPIPAEVEVFVDSSNPEKIIAEVKIQFRTPHLVSQGEVEVEGHRIWLPAKAEPLPIVDVDLANPNPAEPLDAASIERLPMPEPVFLRYEIGTLPPGGYLSLFVMNGFPYSAEDFRVDIPEPPIPAEVALGVDTEDPNNPVAIVKIHFETPHQIVERDLYRRGSKIILEATAHPILPSEDTPAKMAVEGDPLIPNVVVIEYPLRDLEPGEYGAVFVMNGYPYEDAGFVIEEDPQFEAEVRLAVEQSDEGNWIGLAKVAFSDPTVRIINQGEPLIEGHRIKVNAMAGIPLGEETFEQQDIYRYNFGNTLKPGSYVWTYCINERRVARLEFFVEPTPPIPANVELDVEVDGTKAVAVAHIQFKDHFRIVDRQVHQEGNRFCIDLKVEGPLEVLAPLPPPPTKLEIPLGDDLENGKYVVVLKMNEFPYADARFKIFTNPFAADVELKIDVGHTVLATALVDFVDPYVIISNPGVPEIDGNLIKINATANQVVFVQEPSGDPQIVEYELGELEPGIYRLIFCINDQPQAHKGFYVHEDSDKPLPHVSSIEIEEGDASWLATVGLLLLPGQAVSDCGLVRQSDNEFHVNITVDWVDFPEPEIKPLPAEQNDLPEGLEVGPDGKLTIGGFPVRLEECTYTLGVLEPGDYKFFVHSRGLPIARKQFEVPGFGPKAELRAEPISQPNDEPYRFSINYSDPDGLDHESIRGAKVLVHGRNGFESVAELAEYASTDDVPSTGSTAVYVMRAPGGAWDQHDNGKYCVLVDTIAIKDLQGNTLLNGELGCFHVRIFEEPPSPSDARIHIEAGLNDEGMWFADVEIIPDMGVQMIVEDWGQAEHRGPIFVTEAKIVISDTSDAPLREPFAHRYRLGKLGPGFYVFSFKTNLGHHALEKILVPGLPGDPVDNWRGVAGVGDKEDGSDQDGDKLSLLGEYFFALDPNSPDVPEINSEILADKEGKKHLALRFRRLIGADGVREIIEVSQDLKTWILADDTLTEVVDQQGEFDGTEEVVVCLNEELTHDSYQFIRMRVERD